MLTLATGLMNRRKNPEIALADPLIARVIGSVVSSLRNPYGFFL
jgi:hypothetical protein